MTADLQTDLLIFGGGIAGLWLLGRLRQQGYGALLLEAARLGEGQTRFAQGIVHGGTKYALHGTLSPAAAAVAAMPARWRACLEGDGELDLRAARVLSQHHYLWSTGALGSGLAALFASRAMRARTRAVTGERRPEVFRHGDFRGQVYALNEPVVEVASVVRALAEPHGARLLRLVEPWDLRVDEAGVHVDLNGAALRGQAAILCAGAGNAELLERLGRRGPPMQRRPLHMVAARGSLPPLYAHCLGAGATPRLTITTHPAGTDTVWYLGGQLAEEGVGRSPQAQIEAARRELGALLPWVDATAARFASFMLARAEPRQVGGARPAGGFARWDERVLTVWPTKLALAPIVADRVLGLLAAHGITPAADQLPTGLACPAYAPAPWEEMCTWS